MPTLTTTLLTGAAIVERLDDLASLRLEIFREYPYLYQGRREDERTYLSTYAEAPDACIILADDGAKAVGAATGMPLIDEDPSLLTAFQDSPYPLDGIYYVGELLLLPPYRHQGLGHELLTQIEEHIRGLGRYHAWTCAVVERPDDHPLRPSAYRPISRFLDRTGFERLADTTTTLTWTEIDGVKRAHTMQFWIKTPKP